MLTTDKSAGERLREIIRVKGPMTFRDWMETALYNPTAGYYCRLDHSPWGKTGDYRTSAERTILFGATFARYFAKRYIDLGSPNSFTIVDCGAGAGDFARVVLSSFHTQFPKLLEKLNYVVDERGTAFRQTDNEHTDFEVRFDSLEVMTPIEAGIVFANELLDALPVHRVRKQDGVLQEFYVALDSEANFRWKLGSPSTPKLVDYFDSAGIALDEGQVAEINLEAGKWLRKVAEKLKSGFVILVDYGADASDLYQSPERRDGTLRAFRQHRLVDDPLAHPGDQDLTTTVDWTFVQRLSKELGFEMVDFQRQDKFLLAAGILEELEFRTEQLNVEVEKISLRTEAREMVLPSGMAGSFQVLVLRR